MEHGRARSPRRRARRTRIRTVRAARGRRGDRRQTSRDGGRLPRHRHLSDRGLLLPGLSAPRLDRVDVEGSAVHTGSGSAQASPRRLAPGGFSVDGDREARRLRCSAAAALAGVPEAFDQSRSATGHDHRVLVVGRQEGVMATEDMVTNEALLAEKARIPGHVVYCPLVQETVVLNLQSGKYHGLNPTGGRMLELIERSPTIDAAARQLAEEYGSPLETIQADLCDLCRDLIDRGLIEVGPPDAGD